MPCYVDEIQDYGGMVAEAAKRFGTKWCHMTADTPEELHEMAKKLGLRREWCSDHTQPHSRTLHYDLVPSKRARAVKLGALEIKIWGHQEPEEAKKDARKKATFKQGTLFDVGEEPVKLPD